ncbi:MAG: fructose-6-phosphate aldolase [Bacteroidia bacterium]|nr:fructose-6-phosphate aldolase [Bacteroidia bacterium]
MKVRYYLLKVKGVAKIPDYIQIRDERFSLVCYIRADRTEKRNQLPMGLLEGLLPLFPTLPYGEVRAVEWDTDQQRVELI